MDFWSCSCCRVKGFVEVRATLLLIPSTMTMDANISLISMMDFQSGSDSQQFCFVFTLDTVGRSKGKIHLSWIQGAFVDSKCNKCSVDMPERHFVINTVAWRNLRGCSGWAGGIIVVGDCFCVWSYLCWSIFLFIPDSFLIRSFDGQSKEHLTIRELVPFPLQIQLQAKYFSPCLKFSSFYLQRVESIASSCCIYCY